MATQTSEKTKKALNDLFLAMQKQHPYQDAKRLVDLVPVQRLPAVIAEYEAMRKDPSFNVEDFISRHFYQFAPKTPNEFVADTSMTLSRHISVLWHELERQNKKDQGSLLGLPYPYIVPGGRFLEQFYWDSYFIMLGLAADGRWSTVESIVKNCAYMLKKYGFIPTANRSYFLSRSQPPFFSQMVRLLASHAGKPKTYATYLPYLLMEYRFWMNGTDKLDEEEHKAYARLVEMPNGSYLNRYYDNLKTPRPESLWADTETAEESPDREPDRLYLHLRAGAESGWDFSSRWFEKPGDIRTIHTADITPVDLNSLMYLLETTIAEAYRILKHPTLGKRFQKLAERRARAISTYCWSEKHDFFTDYNFHKNQQTNCLSLAAVFPLYAGIATKQQAEAVAVRIKRDFLKKGGLLTTLQDTHEQWDAPNGWAPLHWITIQGLRRYGYHLLANEIKHRWISLTVKVFLEHHKLVEKYNVRDEKGLGGGGEYPLQDGFGWTNGVLLALLTEDDSDDEIQESYAAANQS